MANSDFQDGGHGKRSERRSMERPGKAQWQDGRPDNPAKPPERRNGPCRPESQPVSGEDESPVGSKDN